MKELDSLKRISKGASITLIGALLSKPLGYIYRIILARNLSPSEYGIFSLGLAIFGIVAIIALVGHNEGLERFLGYYKNEKNKIKGFLIDGSKTLILMSIILGFVLFFIANPLAIKIFQNPDLVPILKILAFGLPFYVLSEFINSGFIGLERVKYKLYIKEIFGTVAKIILTIGLLYWGYKTTGATYAYIMGIMLTMFISFYYFNKKVFPIFSKDIEKEKGTNKELISFSWPLLFTGILIMFLFWTDTLMLGHFKDAASVGIYNVAIPTASLLIIIFEAINILFVPELSNLYKNKQKDSIKKIYETTNKWIFFISLPIIILLIFFSEKILIWLFGVEYRTGQFALILLGISVFLRAIFGLAGSIIKIIGKTKINLINIIITFIANIILNLFLIPKYGLIGAATSTLISMAVLSILNLIQIKRYAQLSFNFKVFIKPIVSIIITSTLIIIFFDKIVSIWVFIIFAIIFTGIYLIILKLSKFFKYYDTEIYNSIKRKIIYRK